MVQAAQGAGGPDLQIKGSLDTTNIEQGFQRINQGFDDVKGEAQSFTGDLSRMGQVAGGLANTMAGVAAAGAGAMTTLASQAPAVAPALAEMRVGMQKLTFAAGEALKPVFEDVAGLLDRFAGWAESHPDIFGGLLKTLGGIAALKFTGVLNLLGKLGSTTVGASLMTALPYLALAGGVAFAGAKGFEAGIGGLQKYTGMQDEDFKGRATGQTLLRRLPQQIWADLTDQKPPWEKQQEQDQIVQNAIERAKEGKLSGTEGRGVVRPSMEDDRRFFLLEWWDNVWG